MNAVTVANYVRAESDHMIRASMDLVGVDLGRFVHLREPTTPDWDTDQLAVARKALKNLGGHGFNTTYVFGLKEEVRPIEHFIGAGAVPVAAGQFVLVPDDVRAAGKSADGQPARPVPAELDHERRYGAQ